MDTQYVITIRRYDGEWETVHRQLLDLPDDKEFLLKIADALEGAFHDNLVLLNLRGKEETRAISNLRHSLNNDLGLDE